MLGKCLGVRRHITLVAFRISHVREYNPVALRHVTALLKSEDAIPNLQSMANPSGKDVVAGGDRLPPPRPWEDGGGVGKVGARQAGLVSL